MKISIFLILFFALFSAFAKAQDSAETALHQHKQQLFKNIYQPAR